MVCVPALQSRSKSGSCLYGYRRYFDLQVVSGDHVRGIDNAICDGLSREVSLADLGFLDSQAMSVEDNSCLTDLLAACNPLLDVISVEGFEEQWGHVAAIANQLLVRS